MNCQRARRAVVEEWGSGGAPSWRARRHLRDCEACSLEARLIAETLDQTARQPLPDPGQAYWDDFLPRVRRRIAMSGATHSTSKPSLLLVRPVHAAAAAAAAVFVLAAGLGLWMWRATALPGQESEIAALQAMVDAKIQTSNPAARLTIADMVTPSGADPFGGLSPDWRAPLDEEEARRAVGDLTTLLSPADMEGWPYIDEMVEGLSAEQMKRLLGALGAAGDRPGSGTQERSEG